MRAPVGLLTVFGSFLFTGMVIGNAYIQKKQFYPAVVYITKSNPSMAVLYIQAFVFVIILAKLMRKIFFGQLRAVELEHLIERSWYAVTETCLAFTVFRDDFSTKFVAMFTLLLFLKCFHWLAEDRIDYMESSPMISWLFHMRAISLMVFLGGLDTFFINHAYYSTLAKGASVQLVFGFEYAILSTVVTAVAIKYVLHVIDLQSEIAWDNKAVYLLYTELVIGGLKVVLYSAFMVIMIKVHTFPLFAIRPMYLTIRSFKKAVNDVVMSRRAIRNMNTLYPDATPEDLQSGDNVCIICREEMSINCKKLPCNHIFHSSCLRSWFQRQQTCPTCRMDVLRPSTEPATPAPPAAPQPPPAPNQLPPGFPFWQPAPPQPQGQAPSSSSTTTTPTAVPGATPTTPPPPFMMPPPFMPPPFMMPPPPAPFTTPFPMPSEFAGLSDEELAELEGRERRNIEARIQVLRNIQVLLDAAVLQMNQYSSVVANLPNFSTPSTIGATSTTTTTTTTSSQSNLGASASTSSLGTGAKPKTLSNCNESNSVPRMDADSNTASVTSDKLDSGAAQPSSVHANSVKDSVEDLGSTSLEGAVGFTSPSATSPDDVTDPSTFDDDLIDQGDVNEIRRRRLHRFSSAGAAAADSWSDQ